MDRLTFISEVVRSTAWPVTFLVALLMFRRPIAALVPLLRKLRYREIEADFGAVLAQEQQNADKIGLPPAIAEPSEGLVPPLESLFSVAETSPSAAMLEAFKQLEVVLTKEARDRGLQVTRINESLIRRVVVAKGVRSEAVVQLILRLMRLRNAIAHSQEEDVSVEQAKDYIRLVSRALEALDSPESAA